VRKNIVIAVLATIVIGFVLLLIIGLATQPDYSSSTDVEVPESLVQEELVQPARPEKLSYEEKQGFMAGCNEDGDMEQECSCMIDYLDANYTPAQIYSLYSQYEQTKEYPQPLLDAVYSCL